MSSDKSLLQKLTDAQLRIENPRLDKKGQYGKFASLSECLRVVNDACNPEGLSIYHDIQETEHGYMVSTVITDGKETVNRSPFPANFGSKPQTNGSELTYAKRYSLCAAFGIVGEDDDDGQAAQDAPNKQQSNNALNQAKGRLAISIQQYAERHNRMDEVKLLKDGIKKRLDYEANCHNPEYFDMVASEFDES